MKYAMILFLASLSAFAQSTPEKPDITFTGQGASMAVVTVIPPTATWSDRITKDGHYIATFDDPNNLYRCDVVSYLDADSRNVLYSDITSLTIVCTKKREPEHEK